MNRKHMYNVPNEFMTYNELVSRFSKAKCIHANCSVGSKSHIMRFNILNIVHIGISCLPDSDLVLERRTTPSHYPQSGHDDSE